MPGLPWWRPRVQGRRRLQFNKILWAAHRRPVHAVLGVFGLWLSATAGEHAPLRACVRAQLRVHQLQRQVRQTPDLDAA